MLEIDNFRRIEWIFFGRIKKQNYVSKQERMLRYDYQNVKKMMDFRSLTNRKLINC